MLPWIRQPLKLMGLLVVPDSLPPLTPLSFSYRQHLHRLLLFASNDSERAFVCVRVWVCWCVWRGHPIRIGIQQPLTEVGHIMDSLIKNLCMGVGQPRFWQVSLRWMSVSERHTRTQETQLRTSNLRGRWGQPLPVGTSVREMRVANPAMPNSLVSHCGHWSSRHWRSLPLASTSFH